jgi:hypothetical protein
MTVRGPRYSMEEFARRGQEIYERDIRPHLKTEDMNKSVVIDIETGQWEIDSDELAACERLYSRIPTAQPWAVRPQRRTLQEHFHPSLLGQP